MAKQDVPVSECGCAQCVAIVGLYAEAKRQLAMIAAMAKVLERARLATDEELRALAERYEAEITKQLQALQALTSMPKDGPVQ